MILPTKNIKLQYSLINCGAIILDSLYEEGTVSSVWEKASREEPLINYDKFVLAMDFLYMIGAIKYENGLIVRCSDDKRNSK